MAEDSKNQHQKPNKPETDYYAHQDIDQNKKDQWKQQQQQTNKTELATDYNLLGFQQNQQGSDFNISQSKLQNDLRNQQQTGINEEQSDLMKNKTTGISYQQQQDNPSLQKNQNDKSFQPTGKTGLQQDFSNQMNKGQYMNEQQQAEERQ